MVRIGVVAIGVLVLFTIGSANDLKLWGGDVRSAGLGLAAAGGLAWATRPSDPRRVDDRTRIQVAIAHRAWAPLVLVGSTMYLIGSF